MKKKPLKVEQCIVLSTDFYGHPFVKSIIQEFGPKGYALVTVILMTIGRDGTATVYDKSFTDDILGALTDVSRNLVDMVVRKMVKSGFLDSDAFRKRKVLTPPSVCIVDSLDDVYLSNADITRPYLFVKHPYCSKNVVNSEKTIISSEETAVYSEETPANNVSPLIISDYGTSAEARS